MAPQFDPAADAPAKAADALLRAGVAAIGRGERRDRAVVRAFEAPDEFWPDERTTAALRARIAAAVAPIEREMRLEAAARLAAMQALAAAEQLLDDVEPVAADLAALASAGNAHLLVELLAAARLELLAQSLSAGEVAGDERPSLLVRLVGCPEPDVAAAASALLIAQNRNGQNGHGPSTPPGLPEASRQQIIWWVAALLRDRLAQDPRVDHALVEAAAGLLERTPDEQSPAQAAMRLADLVRPRPDELPALLLEALGDRQLILFIALLAQASGLDFSTVRAAVVDPAGDRLWLLLRAQDLDRGAVARIGVAIAEGDPRRDLDQFATALDAAMEVDPERAAQVFASATLPAPYREALAAVAALR